MKKTLLSVFCFSILLIGLKITLSSSSNGRAFAALSGNTGAPGESTTCRSCHGAGFNTTVSIAIKDNLGNPITAYIPGAVYDAEFTVNASGAIRYGFQMVGLDASNNPVNGFGMPSANTRLVTLGSGRQYAEHAGMSVTNTFTTQWTAPSAGTGTVTFFGGGAAVNLNRTTSGDGGNTTRLSLTENISVGLEENTLDNALLIYPNPARDVINLKSKEVSLENVRADLYSVSGQLVLSRSLNLASLNSKRLDVSNLKNGYYLLRITNGTQSSEKKVLIQN